MTIQSHIESLKKRHGNLDRELSAAIASPSTDDAVITDIKRKKLKLKDEINRLEVSA